MFKGKGMLARRLYVRIYLALLAALAVAAAISASVAHFKYSDPARFEARATLYADVAAELLPAADAPLPVLQAKLRRWRMVTHSDLSLYTAEGKLLARAGWPMPDWNPASGQRGWIGGHPAVFALQLADGRWLLVRRLPMHETGIGLLATLCLIALAVGVAAYPFVRRLTRRLERLQGSVQAWGAGDLSTRVAVEGNDEVARLAQSFNHSAERIEALVGAHKTLLANASHELRSPLARIRMAAELVEGTAPPSIQAELRRNIAELDQLIDEILLASRLDAGPGTQQDEELDLTGMLAEECARTNADLDAQPLLLRGDARLLRRMVRNLLENAQRYGGPSTVNVLLRQGAAGLELDVCDQGPGVPASERERIFTPFYRLPGASEMAGGVGLGLSLVRQIARRHGGDVLCLPNPSGGSCFRVQLPAA